MRATRPVVLLLFCLAMPAGVLAQGNTGPAGNPEHDTRGQSPPETVAPQANRPAPTSNAAPLTPEEAQAHLREIERNAQPGAPAIRAGELELVSASGERLGEVEDVMLDAEGQLAGYVVEAGGVLGIGERRLFVPREATRLERNERGRMVLRTDQQLATFQEASRAAR